MSFKTQESKLHTVSDMKREAKTQLSGNWKNAVILNLIPTIITFIFIFITLGIFSFLFPNMTNTTAENGSGTFNAVIDFGRSFLFLGISYTFLDMVRFDDYQISPIQDAFQIFSQKYFIGNFLIYILRRLYVSLWTLLFIIPGVVKSMSYSQAHFIFKDAKENEPGRQISGNDSITASRRLMDGHKGQYFLLELSFLGWHLLSILLFGIPYLWVFPYLETTRAVFYQNLINDYDYQPEREVNAYDDGLVDVDEEDGFTDF